MLMGRFVCWVVVFSGSCLGVWFVEVDSDVFDCIVLVVEWFDWFYLKFRVLFLLVVDFLYIFNTPEVNCV